MTNPNIKLNAVPVEPTLADLLNLLKKEIFIDMNCHHLATIQSFNSTNQTATATMNYTKTVFQLDPTTGLYQPVQQDYPLMVDMPVIVLGGGQGNLTFPIAAGDQCVVLFNDRSIDNWFQSGQKGPVASSLFHCFSDGLVLVGLNSLNSLISNYDTIRVLLSNAKGKTGVGVSMTQVKIFNELNGSLGPNFIAFFTAFQTFLSACAGSITDPVLASAASAFITALAVPVAPSLLGPIQNIEGVLE
jgi:hypothetical protein